MVSGYLFSVCSGSRPMMPGFEKQPIDMIGTKLILAKLKA